MSLAPRAAAAALTVLLAVVYLLMASLEPPTVALPVHLGAAVSRDACRWLVRIDAQGAGFDPATLPDDGRCVPVVSVDDGVAWARVIAVLDVLRGAGFPPPSFVLNAPPPAR